MNRQHCYCVSLRTLTGIMFAATLAACGGSDDSSPDLSSAAPAPMPDAPASVSGTSGVAQQRPRPTVR